MFSSNRTTRLLAEATNGDRAAADELVSLVYGELRHLAAIKMARGRERPDHTLQPTALVHEVYVKLVGQQADWRNRAQFIGIAAEQMNRVLKDHARKHNAVKRGRDFVKSSMDIPGKAFEPIDVRSPTAAGLPVREALERLAKKHWRRSLVAELHVTWGFTEAQIAECLDLSIEQIRRDWHFARNWLKAELG